LEQRTAAQALRRVSGFSVAGTTFQPRMAADILDAQLMSASVFNTIPTSEQETTFSLDVLRSFAPIFVARQMHLHYGVGILHRHATLLDDGTGMVHSPRSNNVDICNVRQIDKTETKLTHNSLLLNESSKFQAFEYNIGIQRPLDSEFLFRLKELILSAGLAQSVAIIPTPLSDHGEELFEFQLQDEQGIITLPKKHLRQDSIELGKAVTTGWMFRETCEGSIEIHAMKKCVLQTNGLHAVVKDEDVACLLEST